MTRLSVGQLLVLAVIFGSFCVSAEVIFCDARKRNQPCYLGLPYCKAYHYVDNPIGLGTVDFFCDACEDGFEPIPEGETNIPLNKETRLPDFSNLPTKDLKLCQRLGTNSNPIWCTHPACREELPHCRRYTLTNIREVETAEGPIREGSFTCIECDELFTPRNDTSMYVLSDDSTKIICSRKPGFSECGTNCQLEIPGCIGYTISNVQIDKAATTSTELANFICTQPYPGYNALNMIQKINTKTSIEKDLTIHEYQSPKIACEDIKCRHVFPDCKTLYWQAPDFNTNEYVCLECREYFIKREFPVFGQDFLKQYSTKQTTALCQLTEQKNVPVVGFWQELMPGCLKMSISNVESTWEGKMVASFVCDQCAEGMEPINIDQPVNVWGGWDLADSIKPRCRKAAVPKPTVCDDTCQKKLINCQSYTSAYLDSTAPANLTYKCESCGLGLVPSVDGDTEPWYSMSERMVCKPAAFEGTDDCNEGCKQTFPFCDKISITTDPKGHNIYQCQKCSDGFYPIDYEDGQTGRLSALDNEMRHHNTIYLCSNQPNEFYISKTDCLNEDEALFDSRVCQMSVNCNSVAEVRNLLTGDYYLKCLKCGKGFREKTVRSGFYDIDQSLCERIPATTV